MPLKSARFGATPPCAKGVPVIAGKPSCQLAKPSAPEDSGILFLSPESANGRGILLGSGIYITSQNNNVVGRENALVERLETAVVEAENFVGVDAQIHPLHTSALVQCAVSIEDADLDGL